MDFPPSQDRHASTTRMEIFASDKFVQCSSYGIHRINGLAFLIMKNFFKYFSGIFSGLLSLMTGMTVTMSYFVRPWRIVTQKYPENRKKLKIPERFRGELLMSHNEKNEHKCTGCGICELNCPNGTIEVIINNVVNEEGKKKRVLDKYIYHLGMCTFCSLCVKVCPSQAIHWGQDFEQAVFDKQKLNKVLNNEGSTLTKGVE
jgi:NADH-quinone oxidoreductase subunit I